MPYGSYNCRSFCQPIVDDHSNFKYWGDDHVIIKNVAGVIDKLELNMNKETFSIEEAGFSPVYINIIKNSNSEDMILECPWIIHFCNYHGYDLFNFLCENKSIGKAMEALSIPNFLRISKTNKYFDLPDGHTIDQLIKCHLSGNVELKNSIREYLIKNEELPDFKSPISEIPFEYVSFFLKVAESNLEFSKEITDFLYEKYPPFEGSKIKIKTYNGLLSAIEKWHQSLWEGESLDKSDEKLDYGEIPEIYKIGNFEFRALLSERDFFIEGKLMKHCVASYYKSARRDACRVFSVYNLKDDKRSSTLEVVQSNGIYRSGQNKSIYNSRVSLDNSDVIEEFIEHLNNNKFKFGENSIKYDNSGKVIMREISKNSDGSFHAWFTVNGGINLVRNIDGSFSQIETPSDGIELIPEFSADDVINVSVDYINNHLDHYFDPISMNYHQINHNYNQQRDVSISLRSGSQLLFSVYGDIHEIYE